MNSGPHRLCVQHFKRGLGVPTQSLPLACAPAPLGDAAPRGSVQRLPQGCMQGVGVGSRVAGQGRGHLCNGGLALTRCRSGVQCGPHLWCKEDMGGGGGHPGSNHKKLSTWSRGPVSLVAHTPGQRRNLGYPHSLQREGMEQSKNWYYARNNNYNSVYMYDHRRVAAYFHNCYWR